MALMQDLIDKECTVDEQLCLDSYNNYIENNDHNFKGQGKCCTSHTKILKNAEELKA